MPEKEKVKYTKPRLTTNKGPQDFVPPLSWVICLLGRWVVPNYFLVFLPVFLGSLVYLWLAVFHHTQFSIPFFSSCHIMCFSNKTWTAS